MLLKRQAPGRDFHNFVLRPRVHQIVIPRFSDLRKLAVTAVFSGAGITRKKAGLWALMGLHFGQK